MEIPNKGEFQPSSDTLKFWLSTRKANISVAGVDMPGFFSDTDSAKDSNWFYFAIIGELLGLALTIYGGMRSGGVFLLIAIVTVIAFIIIDIVFAKLLHADESNKCELRSKKLVVDDSTIINILKIDEELNKGKMKLFFFRLVIITIAIAKSFGVILLGVFNSLLIYIPIIVIFLLIAYAHIYHTGFFLAYRKAMGELEKDHKVFRQGGGYTALRLEQSYESALKLKVKEGTNSIELFPHKIILKAEESSNKFKYEIQSKGVLTDAEILGLISAQDKSNKIELFKACRELQLLTLNSQPKI